MGFHLMNISFLKVFILIISLNIILSYNTIETTGDIFQVGVPLSALYMTYANNDNIGRQIFLKSFLTTFAATHILKRVVARERPDSSNSLSFPSGHTSHIFTVATIANELYGKQVGAVAYCLAALVATSRIHDNKHYLSDVIFGAGLGTAVGRGFALTYRDRINNNNLIQGSPLIFRITIPLD